MHRGSKNESDRGASHPGRNSWEAAQVYPRANRADQKSGCSRLGISLRQPRFKTGTGPLRRNGSALLQLTKERPEQNSRSAPVDPTQAPTPRQEWAKTANGAGAASFAIKMQYRGDVRTTELPLAQDEPVPGDEQATWSRSRLMLMDRRFVERLARALRTGGESAAAATATINPERR